jgi:hypothetical protein
MLVRGTYLLGLLACAAHAGVAFQELGGSATGNGVSDAWSIAGLRIAVGPSGTPWTGWTDSRNGNEEMYVKTLSGGTWVGVGGSDSDGGISQGSGVPTDGGGFSALAAMAVDALDRPYAVWMNYLGFADQPVYLRYWDGADWVGLGGSDTGQGLSGSMATWWPTIVWDPLGNPVIGWMAYGQVFVSHWYAGVWGGYLGSDMGNGLSEPNAIAGIAGVAKGPSGQYYVVWVDRSITVRGQIYLAHWDGAAWSEMGGSASDGGISNSIYDSEYPVVGDDGTGHPIVTWNTALDAGTRTDVRRWDGAAWSALGGVTSLQETGFAANDANNVALAVDSAGNAAFVWSQTDPTGLNIYGARWSGGQWDVLGNAPPNGGISQTHTSAGWPSVALDPRGLLYVSWFQVDATGFAAGYVKRSTTPFASTADGGADGGTGGGTGGGGGPTQGVHHLRADCGCSESGVWPAAALLVCAGAWARRSRARRQRP